MSWYLLIKTIHMSAAALSISGFIIRGLLLYIDIDYRRHRLTHTLPHVIDTVLLGSAIYLAVSSAQYPVQQAWLSAKLIGLLVYIVLGLWALKWARSGTERVAAMIISVLCFAYIVTVALSRSTWPF
jgi:uncharacterized membrane protein SirB2